jgi:hypothetical protein
MLGRSFLAVPLLLLAACGEEAPVVHSEQDPAMTAALNGLLMTDPDLVGHNDAASALLLPDSNAWVPVEDDSPRAVAAAREEAQGLVGGPGRMQRAPAPERVERASSPEAALTAAARGAAAPGTGPGCADAVSYTAAWAARMPETFPVYPRGAVQEAAGTDAGGCALRVVSFTTPVPLGDVIDFYFTRASKAGFAVRHAADGRETMLGGSKGRQSFAVYALLRADGMTSVDLVTNGE